MPSLAEVAVVEPGWTTGQGGPAGFPSAGTLGISGPVAFKAVFTPSSAGSGYRAIAGHQSPDAEKIALVLTHTGVIAGYGLGTSHWLSLSPTADVPNECVWFFKNGASVRMWLNGTYGSGGAAASSNAISAAEFFQGSEGWSDPPDNTVPASPWAGTIDSLTCYPSDFNESQLAYLVGAGSVASIQTITINGNAGTWRFGAGTTDLAWNASAAEVEAEIETVLAVGVSVSKTGTVYTVTFDDAGAQSTFTVDDSGLTSLKVQFAATTASVTEGQSIPVVASITATSSEVVVVKLNVDSGTASGSDFTLGGNGPMLLASLEEGSGSVATDSVHGWNGTIANGASFVTDAPSGHPTSTKAILFDGTNDYVEFPALFSVGPDASFAVSGYVKKTVLNPGARAAAISFMCDDHQPEIVIGTKYSGSNKLCCETGISFVGVTSIDTTADANAGQWYHVLLSVENGVPSFYVDGVLIGTLAQQWSGYTPVLGGWRLGLEFADTDGFGFPGRVDEFAIWPLPLNGGDATRIASGLTTVTGSNCIVIYPGETSGSASFTAVSDVATEGDETVVLGIASVLGPAEENGTQQITITISDSAPPTISLKQSTYRRFRN
jgi:hypothetical protein